LLDFQLAISLSDTLTATNSMPFKSNSVRFSATWRFLDQVLQLCLELSAARTYLIHCTKLDSRDEGSAFVS